MSLELADQGRALINLPTRFHRHHLYPFPDEGFAYLPVPSLERDFALVVHLDHAIRR